MTWRIGRRCRSSRTDTASGQPRGRCSIFRSLVRYDPGVLVRGAATGSKRPSRVKIGASYTPHVGVPARCRLTTRSGRFEFASEKAADFSAALLVFRLLSAFSVAIGADSNADARGADADAATVPVTAALDIRSRRGAYPYDSPGSRTMTRRSPRSRQHWPASLQTMRTL
jgi:hypothetical protein